MFNLFRRFCIAIKQAQHIRLKTEYSVAAGDNYAETVKTEGVKNIAASCKQAATVIVEGELSIAAKAGVYGGAVAEECDDGIAVVAGKQCEAISKAISAASGPRCTASTSGTDTCAVATGWKSESRAEGDRAVAVVVRDKQESGMNPYSACADGVNCVAVTTARYSSALATDGVALATSSGVRAEAFGPLGVAITTNRSGYSIASKKKNRKDKTAGVAIALGEGGLAAAEAGGWIVIAMRDDSGAIVDIKYAKVGSNKIKAGCKYKLDKDGKFVAV